VEPASNDCTRERTGLWADSARTSLRNSDPRSRTLIDRMLFLEAIETQMLRRERPYHHADANILHLAIGSHGPVRCSFTQFSADTMGRTAGFVASAARNSLRIRPAFTPAASLGA